MKRDIEADIFAWKARADRKPLVLMGARQVGKTWLMRDFGKRNFANVHEFNFDDNPDLARVFKASKDPAVILPQLAILSGRKIDIENVAGGQDTAGAQVWRHSGVARLAEDLSGREGRDTGRRTCVVSRVFA